MCIQQPLQSPTKILFSTSVNFYLPIPLLLVYKIIHTNPINTTFLYTSTVFHLTIFVHNHPSNLHQRYFPYLSHLANLGCILGTRELESLATTDIVWISPFFLKVWTVITGLTITDSLFGQALNIGVLQVVVSNEDDACNRNDKPFNPPSLIPSNYCHYFYTLLIPSQKLIFLWKPVA